jgi:hypothetical protein
MMMMKIIIVMTMIMVVMMMMIIIIIQFTLGNPAPCNPDPLMIRTIFVQS